MSVYTFGVCRFCNTRDCLKDGICPICAAKQEATDIPEVLKEMFK